MLLSRAFFLNKRRLFNNEEESESLYHLSEIFPEAVKDQTFLDVDELGKAKTIQLEAQ